MTNLQDKTTIELHAMMADIQIELKLREMIETAEEVKETKKLKFNTADISSGMFINPSLNSYEGALCNRLDDETFSEPYRELLYVGNKVFTYDISRGDVLEFVSWNGLKTKQTDMQTNYILVLDKNENEILYQEFEGIDDALEAQKDMPKLEFAA